MIRIVFAFLTATLLVPSITSAGDLIGRYVFDGPVPQLADVSPAVANCTESPIVDESLVVSSDNNGIANIAVYLRRAPKGVPANAQPQAEAVPVQDQKGCRFIPRMLVFQAGQTPLVKSNDSVAHNVRGALLKNDDFNFTVGGVNRTGIPIKGIDRADILPMPIKCDIHPYMTAYWLVVDHPYTAVTDADGKFKITGLPAGKHKFRVWHERSGYLEKSIEFEIFADKPTDIGEIKVTRAQLQL